MSFLRICTSVVILLFHHVSGSVSWGADDPKLRARVLAEYPKALESLGAQYSHMQGRGIMRSLEKTTPRTRQAVSLGVEFEYGPNRRILRRFAATKGLLDASGGSGDSSASLFNNYPEKVLLFNPNYSATLTRPSHQSGFSIGALDASPDASRRGIVRYNGYLIECATTADASPIDRLMKLPQFRLDRAEPERAEDGSDRVRIVYSMVRDSFPEKAAVVRLSGWLVVDPSHHWILHESGSVSSYKSGLSFTKVGRMKYDLTDTNQPKPISSTNYQYAGRHEHDPARDDPSLKPEEGDDFRFLDVRFGYIPERNFTLSAFGLPEFNQAITPRPTRSKTPWWIFGVSAIALGVGIMARRMGSKSKSVEPT